MTDLSSYPGVDVAKQEAMDGSPAVVELFNRKNDPGQTHGPFGEIHFQFGPIAEAGINGTTIEDVVEALIARLEGFQKGPFACTENDQAIRYFEQGAAELAARTQRRQDQGVEGTNQPHES